MFYILFAILFLPMLIICPTIVKGKKNIPKKGRFILCCNHQSNTDVFRIMSRLKRRYKYLAKKELFNTKIKNWFFKTMGAYPIERGKPDLQAIKKTINYLKDEKAVCIFPEGTRVTNDEKSQLKGGVVMFALKTDSPIVPCCILKKPRPFRWNKMIVGEPFKLSDIEEFKGKSTDKETIQKATELLSQKMEELKINTKEKK